LEEVQKSTVALLVTAYRLQEGVTGVELASEIIHQSLGTPVIVLAEDGDPEVDAQTLREASFQYFMRPVAEPFLRGLRIALDGESAVVAEQQEPATAADLGPVPNIDIKALRGVTMSLMRDVGAMGVILADRTGRVLVDEGATGYIDREQLAIILGPAFSRSADVSPLIGGRAWTMHYYDGERLDVFGLSLGVHHFMCLIFEGSNRGAFGAVMMFGRRAADQMIDMIGDAAFTFKRSETRPAKEGPKPTKAAVQAAPPAPPMPARQKSAPKAKKEKEAVLPPLPPTPAPASSAPFLEPVGDMDLDALFGQGVDENLADSMFDPDTLSNIADTLIAEEGERVGYDDARNMGILNE
jgi:hypothetical protein